MKYNQNILKILASVAKPMLIFNQKWYKIWNLTLTFDLEMTLSFNSHWPAKRDHIYLTIGEIRPKYIEHISLCGFNNANFGPKMVQIPKIDLDL